MPDRAQLLDAIRRRPATTRSGIALARSYVVGAEASAESPWRDITASADWPRVLREADDTLVYRNDRMKLLSKKLAGVTPGGCMDFTCVVTTTRKDRDGDVLETGGAKPDPAMPLLWQHVPVQPIGKLVKVLDHSSRRLTGHFTIVDMPLGHDAAQLVEFGALRISHGFRPTAWEPLDEKDQAAGFRVLEFEILEASLVSVPSNADAVITAFNRNKLHHPCVKTWAAGLHARRARPVNVPFAAAPEANVSPVVASVAGASVADAPAATPAADTPGTPPDAPDYKAALDAGRPAAPSAGVTEVRLPAPQTRSDGTLTVPRVRITLDDDRVVACEPTGEMVVPRAFAKAGRALSKKNEDRLKECLDLLKDMAARDDCSAPMRALCERVQRIVQAMTDELYPEEGGEGDGKAARSPEQAAVLLIGHLLRGSALKPGVALTLQEVVDEHCAQQRPALLERLVGG